MTLDDIKMLKIQICWNRTKNVEYNPSVPMNAAFMFLMDSQIHRHSNTKQPFKNTHKCLNSGGRKIMRGKKIADKIYQSKSILSILFWM